MYQAQRETFESYVRFLCRTEAIVRRFQSNLKFQKHIPVRAEIVYWMLSSP